MAEKITGNEQASEVTKKTKKPSPLAKKTTKPKTTKTAKPKAEKPKAEKTKITKTKTVKPKVAPKKKTAAPAEAAAPTNVEVTPVAEAPAVSGPVAPGSAGQLKLYDTPPKTAAMLMAIVAHQMGKPLNELRFISIKEVK
jgi:hypothetical protein